MNNRCLGSCDLTPTPKSLRRASQNGFSTVVSPVPRHNANLGEEVVRSQASGRLPCLSMPGHQLHFLSLLRILGLFFPPTNSPRLTAKNIISERSFPLSSCHLSFLLFLFSPVSPNSTWNQPSRWPPHVSLSSDPTLSHERRAPASAGSCYTPLGRRTARALSLSLSLDAAMGC